MPDRPVLGGEFAAALAAAGGLDAVVPFRPYTPLPPSPPTAGDHVWGLYAQAMAGLWRSTNPIDNPFLFVNTSPARPPGTRLPGGSPGNRGWSLFRFPGRPPPPRQDALAGLSYNQIIMRAVIRNGGQGLVITSTGQLAVRPGVLTPAETQAAGRQLYQGMVGRLEALQAMAVRQTARDALAAESQAGTQGFIRILHNTERASWFEAEGVPLVDWQQSYLLYYSGQPLVPPAPPPVQPVVPNLLGQPRPQPPPAPPSSPAPSVNPSLGGNRFGNGVDPNDTIVTGSYAGGPSVPRTTVDLPPPNPGPVPFGPEDPGAPWNWFGQRDPNQIDPADQAAYEGGGVGTAGSAAGSVISN